MEDTLDRLAATHDDLSVEDAFRLSAASGVIMGVKRDAQAALDENGE